MEGNPPSNETITDPTDTSSPSESPPSSDAAGNETSVKQPDSKPAAEATLSETSTTNPTGNSCNSSNSCNISSNSNSNSNNNSNSNISCNSSTTEHKKAIDTMSVTQTQTTIKISNVAAGVLQQFNNSEDHTHSQHRRSVSNEFQSQQRPPLAPSNSPPILDTAGSSTSNEDITNTGLAGSEATIRLSGVPTNMIVKKKKGRFSLLQEATTPIMPESSEDTAVVTRTPYQHERSSSTSSVDAAMASPKTFDGTGAPTVKKKGRFVVTNVKDPGFVAVPVQAVMTPVTTTQHMRANSLSSIPQYSTVMLASNSMPPLQQQPIMYTTTSTEYVVYDNMQQQQQQPIPPKPPAGPSDASSTQAPKKPDTTRRTASVPHSARTMGGGLQRQQGFGKVMYFLDQMRLEVSEADKNMKSMQTDMRCLRDKNKEMEAKLRDVEKKWLEEKALREGAEKRCRQLRKKIRQMEGDASSGHDDDGLQGTKIGHTRSDSIDQASLSDMAQLTLSASDDALVTEDKNQTSTPLPHEANLAATRTPADKQSPTLSLGNTSMKPSKPSQATQPVGAQQHTTTPPRDQNVANKSAPMIPPSPSVIHRSMSSDTPPSARIVRNMSVDSGVESAPGRTMQHMASPSQTEKASVDVSLSQNMPSFSHSQQQQQYMYKPKPQDFDPLRPTLSSEQTQFNAQEMSTPHTIYLSGQNVAFPIVDTSQGINAAGHTPSPTPPQTPLMNGQVPSNPYIQHGDFQTLQQPMLVLSHQQFTQMQDWPQQQMIFPAPAMQSNFQHQHHDAQIFTTQNPFDNSVQAVSCNGQTQSGWVNNQPLPQTVQQHRPSQQQQSNYTNTAFSSQNQLQWMQQPATHTANKSNQESQKSHPDVFENLIT